MKLRCTSGSPFIVVAALTIAASVVVAGSSAATPVTKARYAAMLKQELARIGKVERAAQLGLARKAPAAEMKRLILAWAAGANDVGEAFQQVRPPADAAAANALLARGEITTARELTEAANHLPSKPSAIGGYLAGVFADARGPKLVIQALTKLRVAGYY
jgi:hypothetical protein